MPQRPLDCSHAMGCRDRSWRKNYRRLPPSGRRTSQLCSLLFVGPLLGDEDGVGWPVGQMYFDETAWDWGADRCSRATGCCRTTDVPL
jgi:hypothetical protein